MTGNGKKVSKAQSRKKQAAKENQEKIPHHVEQKGSAMKARVKKDASILKNRNDSMVVQMKYNFGKDCL